MNEVRDVGTSFDDGATTTDSITMASVRIAGQIGAAAIVCLSRTGYTVRSVSRFRPETSILAFSPDERAVRQLSLSWGSQAIANPESSTARETIEEALLISRQRFGLHTGDRVVVISGQSMSARATDTIRVMSLP